MPIYDFKCPNCGKEFERFYKKISDLTHEECECGHMAKKIMSCTGNFQIKGFSAKNGYSPEGLAEGNVGWAKEHNKELYKAEPEKFANRPSYVPRTKGKPHIQNKVDTIKEKNTERKWTTSTPDGIS